MKRIGTAIAAGVLFGVGTVAQTQTSGQTNPAANAEGGATLASGTAINAELSSSVDSKKAKPGDTVKAKVTEPATSNGQTVLPKGTQLLGHVTEASARAKGGNESALGIKFDKAVLKSGEEVPLNVSVQALASEPAGTTSNGPGYVGPAGGPGSGGGMPGTGMSGGGMSGGSARGSTGAPSSAPNPGGSTGYPTSTVDNTGRPTANTGGANGGLDASGHLAPNSRGVYGLEGLTLNTPTPEKGSVIVSTGKNVHLDSGTRMLLMAQAGPSATQTPSK